jgi:hypothetical protein
MARNRHRKTTRLRTARGKKARQEKGGCGVAILVGNAVTTSAELPTVVDQSVFYSAGIAGIGPAGNLSKRDTKTL